MTEQGRVEYEMARPPCAGTSVPVCLAYGLMEGYSCMTVDRGLVVKHSTTAELGMWWSDGLQWLVWPAAASSGLWVPSAARTPTCYEVRLHNFVSRDAVRSM